VPPFGAPGPVPLRPAGRGAATPRAAAAAAKGRAVAPARGAAPAGSAAGARGTPATPLVLDHQPEALHYPQWIIAAPEGGTSGQVLPGSAVSGW